MRIVLRHFFVTVHGIITYICEELRASRRETKNFHPPDTEDHLSSCCVCESGDLAQEKSTAHFSKQGNRMAAAGRLAARFTCTCIHKTDVHDDPEMDLIYCPGPGIVRSSV